MPVKVSASVAGILILFYGALTGFSVSALRAVIMFLLHMLAYLTGRTYDMLTALGVAGALILLGRPLYLFHSGFLFSFGCVLGIGLLAPVLTQAAKPLPRPVKGLLSGAAMLLCSLPIYLKYYYQFPPYSMLLNFLVIPLMSFLMGAGLWVLFFSMILPPLCLPGELVIEGIISIYEHLCLFCEKLPFHLLTPGEPAGWQFWAYFGLLLLVVMSRKRLCFAGRWAVAAAAAALLLIHPQTGLSLTFLDVGQGDGIFLETPKENCYLIDGGSSSAYEVGERRLLPFLQAKGASKIKAVFVTHPDEDHCNGIRYLLEQGRTKGIVIESLVLPDIGRELWNNAYEELVGTAEAVGIQVQFISAGQRIETGEMTLTCLNPSRDLQTFETNTYSIVLLLQYGNFSALLTGDVQGAGEAQVLQALQESHAAAYAGSRLTVLKAAHHGSDSSTPEKLLALSHPVYTVISCGEDNSYGHPHPQVVKRLEKYDSRILITWQEGAVTFWTDGESVRVERFLRK